MVASFLGSFVAGWAVDRMVARGIISTALQEMTPNDYRGRVSALFLLVANLVGFGLGPLAPAALTDYLFRDDGTLGLSVAIVSIVTGPLGGLLLWLGCRPMRAVLQPSLHRPGSIPAEARI